MMQSVLGEKYGPEDWPCEPFPRAGPDGDGTTRIPRTEVFKRKLAKLDTRGVVRDIRQVLNNSVGCWPADFGYYGPLFVRLAWHASGTYRQFDGSGGSPGGRIRFNPEANWADNANLDKARALLYPIKMKWGHGLSWGDLFILAGTEGIHQMGGPTKSFCFGRIDEADGRKSDMLNCDPDWDASNQLKSCDVLTNGTWPGGQDVSGLIYVNPQGPNGDPNPYLSAQDVKRTFGRMGMNFRQTVALIGGGHAFGKCHGGSAGPDGVDTSGFEGQWTPNPIEWDNDYFKALMNYDWKQVTKHGETIQWETVNRESEFKDAMMLTADIALKAHPDYSTHARAFADSRAELDIAFAQAWDQLITNGQGWLDEKRCISLDME